MYSYPTAPASRRQQNSSPTDSDLTSAQALHQQYDRAFACAPFTPIAREILGILLINGWVVPRTHGSKRSTPLLINQDTYPCLRAYSQSTIDRAFTDLEKRSIILSCGRNEFGRWWKLQADWRAWLDDAGAPLIDLPRCARYIESGLPTDHPLLCHAGESESFLSFEPFETSEGYDVSSNLTKSNPPVSSDLTKPDESEFHGGMQLIDLSGSYDVSSDLTKPDSPISSDLTKRDESEFHSGMQLIDLSESCDVSSDLTKPDAAPSLSSAGACARPGAEEWSSDPIRVFDSSPCLRDYKERSMYVSGTSQVQREPDTHTFFDASHSGGANRQEGTQGLPDRAARSESPVVPFPASQPSESPSERPSRLPDPSAPSEQEHDTHIQSQASHQPPKHDPVHPSSPNGKTPSPGAASNQPDTHTSSQALNHRSMILNLGRGLSDHPGRIERKTPVAPAESNQSSNHNGCSDGCCPSPAPMPSLAPPAVPTVPNMTRPFRVPGMIPGAFEPTQADWQRVRGVLESLYPMREFEGWFMRHMCVWSTEWIVKAIKRAFFVKGDVRHVGYFEATLRNWTREGDAPPGKEDDHDDRGHAIMGTYTKKPIADPKAKAAEQKAEQRAAKAEVETEIQRLTERHHAVQAKVHIDCIDGWEKLTDEQKAFVRENVIRDFPDIAKTRLDSFIRAACVKSWTRYVHLMPKSVPLPS